MLSTYSTTSLLQGVPLISVTITPGAGGILHADLSASALFSIFPIPPKYLAMRTQLFILFLLLTGVSLQAQRTSLKVNETTSNDRLTLTVKGSDHYAADMKAAFLEVAGRSFGKQAGGILVHTAEEGVTMQLDVRRNRLSIEQTEDSSAALAKAKEWAKVIKTRMKKDAPAPPPPPATPQN
jgi:hypothetical protein